MPIKISRFDLKDHIAKKRKLIAPFNRNPKLKKTMYQSSWHLERLPEIIWIGELIHKLGPKSALEVLVSIVELVQELMPKYSHFCYNSSCWNLLSNQSKGEISNKLYEKFGYNTVVGSFSTLLTYYPNYQLFLHKIGKRCQPDSLDSFKGRLTSYLSRFSKASVQIQCHIFITEIRTGNLKIAQHISLPDLNDIYTKEEGSDEFERAAGFVRASTMSAVAFTSLQHPFTAAKYFWNRGLELEKCILPNMQNVN